MEVAVAWYGSLGKSCPGCKEDHHLVYNGVETPDSLTRYVFICPHSNKSIDIYGIRAWTDDKMFRDYVEIKYSGDRRG